MEKQQVSIIKQTDTVHQSSLFLTFYFLLLASASASSLEIESALALVSARRFDDRDRVSSHQQELELFKLVPEGEVPLPETRRETTRRRVREAT